MAFPTNTVVLWILKIVLFLYDILTLPFYSIAQQPWIKRRDHKEPKAIAVNYENGITYRSITAITRVHIEMERGKIDTMQKVFSYAVSRNGDKKCIGSREIIDEEDEMQPNGRLFKKYVLGEYMWKSYNQVESLALHFSRGLLELGLKPKERIAIFAESRAEWLLAAIAANKQNITIVTLYATLGDDAVIHGLNETEVTHVLTSHELLPKFRNILPKVATVKNLIFMEDSLKKTDVKGFKEDVQINSFCSVVELGSQSKKTETSPPSPGDVAIIMYTSGSTGVPKGVELSQNNIVTGMMAFTDGFGEIYPDDTYISFLPLAHVLEFMVESFAILCGIPIGYSSPLTMIDGFGKVKRGCKGDASVLKPTIMASVPLILDRIYKTIQDSVVKSGKLQKQIFDECYNYKIKWYRRGYNTPILNQLLFANFSGMLGGRVRLIVTGGAPLAPDTQEFLRGCLGCPILQGYGLTETSACATATILSDRSTGRVGATLGCCDIRLVDWEEGNYRITDHPHPRGEVLIGGDNVSLGYFKLPGATDAEFFNENGRRWFRSGDIGEMYPDGVLKIIDRKKDLVKLQFGEYVSLGKVESELKACPVVDNICIYGDSTKLFCIALVVPSVKHLQNLATKLGRPSTATLDQLCSDVDVEKAVLKELQDTGVKSKLAKFELPGAVKLISELWTPELDLVTAAFKLKRKNIQIRYQKDIDRLYAASG